MQHLMKLWEVMTLPSNIVHLVFSGRVFDSRANLAIGGILTPDRDHTRIVDALAEELWGREPQGRSWNRIKNRSPLVIPFELNKPTLRFFQVEDAGPKEVFGMR